MEFPNLGQQTNLKNFSTNSYLKTSFEQFLIDRRAKGLTPGTIDFYRENIECFLKYCDSQLIQYVEQITPETIRQYLLHLENTGHNPGGRHNVYRSLRAMLHWWEREYEPEHWKNPIKKVNPPKVRLAPLKPVELDIVRALVATCKSRNFYDLRDRAILLALLDTGARATEFLSVDLADYQPELGKIRIRYGKGGKERVVFVGDRTRRHIREYQRKRSDECPAFWVNNEGNRLAYWGLRKIMVTRSQMAGVTPAPALHSFRRAFALSMLRNGVDIYTLKELMGHRDIVVLQRYLKLVDDDLRLAHHNASPVDRWKL